MERNVLVDASFLVAVLGRRDTHHRWAVAAAERFPPPWRTCEAALSEAFHLLGAEGIPALRGLLERGAVAPAFDLGDNLEPVLKLLVKYKDQRASLADACLVRMSEKHDHHHVYTLDRDFTVYRKRGHEPIPLIIPPTKP